MPAQLRKHRALSAAFCLLFVAPAICSAQAVVVVLAVGNPKNPTLSNVIAKAASVQLSGDADITPTVADSTSIAGEQTSTGSRQARSSETDFLLLVNYTQQGNQVRLDMSLRSAGTATTLASSSELVPFDLNLDVSVSASVAKLMATPGVESAIRAAAKGRAAARSKIATAAPPSSGGGGNGGASPASSGTPLTGGSSGQGASTIGGRAGAGSVQPGTGAPSLRRWAFVFSGGGAPLILVGNASNYFRYGAGGSLFAGAHFPFSRIDFQAGLTAGGAALFPAVGLTEGIVYSALGGPELRLGTASSLPVGIGIQLAGGAAVIIAKPAGTTAFEAKTDLFASGSVTAHLRIFRSMVVGTELKVLAVFEERYPLIAFAPTLRVGFSP